jgi:hypothetical protein
VINEEILAQLNLSVLSVFYISVVIFIVLRNSDKDIRNVPITRRPDVPQLEPITIVS